MFLLFVVNGFKVPIKRVKKSLGYSSNTCSLLAHGLKYLVRSSVRNHLGTGFHTDFKKKNVLGGSARAVFVDQGY